MENLTKSFHWIVFITCYRLPCVRFFARRHVFKKWTAHLTGKIRVELVFLTGATVVQKFDAALPVRRISLKPRTDALRMKHVWL